MKRAVALGFRTAAGVKAAVGAAPVQRIPIQPAAAAAATTTNPPSAPRVLPHSPAVFLGGFSWTRRGRGGGALLSDFSWGPMTERADLPTANGLFCHLPLPSGSPLAAAAAGAPPPCTAAAAAATASLLQRHTHKQQRLHIHLSEVYPTFLAAQRRCFSESVKGPGDVNYPRPATAPEPTQAPPQQQQQQQQQQQHQQQQHKHEGAADTSKHARRIAAVGASGMSGANSSWLRALGSFAFAGVKKLLKFSWQFFVGLCRYTVQFVRNPRIVTQWYAKGKEAALHTWRWCCTGFRLFFANVRVSHQLLKKKILGYPLRYNEHKLLVRTTADALKLIPFSLLIIIPLGELLIPVALRLFPNMLPSTFQEKPVDHAYLSRKLQAKQELAAFFQELLQERTKELIEQTPAADSAAKAKALKSFQAKLLKPTASGEPPLPGLKEILEFSRLFKDDFVLSKMDIQTLQVMCKLLGLQPYSVRTHVVLQLRHHINHIQREDREFLWEGVESLTHEELVEACRDRGMKFYGTTDDAMREQMRRWLEVSSHRDVPPILLLWSRCVSMIPAVHLQPAPAAAAAAAAPGAAEAQPSISLAAVTHPSAAEAARLEEERKEEAATKAHAADATAAPEAATEHMRSTASLEAMTRQVELLREEEESLKQSISLLQEERAQHKQMQKMQMLSKEESAADVPHQAAPFSQQEHEAAEGEAPSGAAKAAHAASDGPQGDAEAGPGVEAAESAEATNEGREGRDVERELRLLRQLTDIQHEHEERQFHVFNQVQMAVEALKSKLAPASRQGDSEGGTAAAGEELKPDPNEMLKQRAAELLHDELHELDLCMALLAQEFAEDAKEVEHFMRDARNLTDNEKAEAGGGEEGKGGLLASADAPLENAGTAPAGAKEKA